MSHTFRMCERCREVKNARAFRIARRLRGKGWNTQLSGTCLRCERRAETLEQLAARLLSEAAQDRSRSQMLAQRAVEKERQAREYMGDVAESQRTSHYAATG